MTRVFEELKATDCRWPLAEFDRGEFLFCGEPPDGGLWSSRKVSNWMAEELGLISVAPQRDWQALKAIDWSIQKPRRPQRGPRPGWNRHNRFRPASRKWCLEGPASWCLALVPLRHCLGSKADQFGLSVGSLLFAGDGSLRCRRHDRLAARGLILGHGPRTFLFRLLGFPVRCWAFGRGYTGHVRRWPRPSHMLNSKGPLGLLSRCRSFAGSLPA